ncbi:hypothetical protein BD408DRAFT_464394, partial [Parasitella parasitica]
ICTPYNWFVRTLYTLFKDNRIRTNVNGIVSTCKVLKLRGLKQGGDLISCILYNFALEPLCFALSWTTHSFMATSFTTNMLCPR